MLARNHVAALCVLVLATAASAPAFAQTPSGVEPYAACNKTVAEQSAMEAAHARYLSGRVDYDEGRYDAAIEQFREAYKRDCTKHEILIIISRAYELNGNLPEAIYALETYLDRAKPPTEPERHRSRIGNLKERLAQQKSAAPANPAPVEPAPATEPTEPGPTEPEPAPPEQKPAQGHTLAPWIVVGVGGAAIVTGAVLVAVGAFTLPGNCDRSTEKCTRTPGESQNEFNDDQDLAGRAKGMQTGGLITMVGGGVLVAGGLLWHFLEPTGPGGESAKTKVTPAFGAGYAGLAYGGRF